MNYWLFKTEPDTFSINDLESAKNQTEMWDGVRNYQARNFLRDQIKKGDQILIYHSSCKVPAIMGVAEVVKPGYPDPTQFDRHNPYYDPKSSPETPRWFCVDIKHKETFKNPLPLATMKNIPALQGMPLVKKGNRLSIMPVTRDEWEAIITLQ